MILPSWLTYSTSHGTPVTSKAANTFRQCGLPSLTKSFINRLVDTPLRWDWRLGLTVVILLLYDNTSSCWKKLCQWVQLARWCKLCSSCYKWPSCSFCAASMSSLWMVAICQKDHISQRQFPGVWRSTIRCACFFVRYSTAGRAMSNTLSAWHTGRHLVVKSCSPRYRPFNDLIG